MIAHMYYTKIINAAISRFIKSKKRGTAPPQLHFPWIFFFFVSRKWRQVFDRMLNVEITILTNDRDAIISKEG